MWRWGREQSARSERRMSGEKPQRRECAPDDSGVRECAAGRAAVRVCKPFRDSPTTPCQNSATMLQERRFAAFPVQLCSVQLRGIWSNFALKRTRLEHVGLISRSAGFARRFLHCLGTRSLAPPCHGYSSRLSGRLV